MVSALLMCRASGSDGKPMYVRSKQMSLAKGKTTPGLLHPTLYLFFRAGWFDYSSHSCAKYRA